MFLVSMQVLASHLQLTANQNAKLAVPSLLWLVNSIKLRQYFALLSDPSGYLAFCV